MSLSRRLVLAFLALIGIHAAAQELSLVLADGAGRRGEEVTLALEVEGITPFGGVNTRVDLPPGVSFVRAEPAALAASVGDTLLLDVHSYSLADHQRVAVVVATKDGEGTITGPGPLLNLVVHIDDSAPVGTSPIAFVEDGTAVATPDGTATLPVLAFSSELAIRANPSADVNGDGQRNAIDVQLVVNAVLRLPIGDFNADVNGDGAIDAIDVQGVVNAVLGIAQ